MAKPPCDLCNGTGEASLRDKRGDTHYLECPECDGTGVDFDAEDEDEDEDDEKVDEETEEFEYPRSTAASITTPEQLKAAVERWNTLPKPPPIPPEPKELNLMEKIKAWLSKQTMSVDDGLICLGIAVATVIGLECLVQIIARAWQ